MPKHDLSMTRRGFLWGASAGLAYLSAYISGCKFSKKTSKYQQQERTAAEPNSSSPGSVNPSSWWQAGNFFVHDRVDPKNLNQGAGVIRSFLDGDWQEFQVVELPEKFIDWSLKTRIARLDRMIEIGGLDPRDLAGSHNACVATYGGPKRDSAISLNTAYKGMGFAIKPEKLADTVQKIQEERVRLERDFRGDPRQEIYAKVRFLAELYHDDSSFDRTKQVSLELFTSPDFPTHTFLNMMANPITSASFLAFPTFEIRAVPQLLHPLNPHLSPYERNLIAYTNAIHDFIHHGLGDRITCIYHIIEVFDDTPNDMSKGKKIAGQ